MYAIKINHIAERAIPKEGEMLVRAVLFAALTGIGALMRIPTSPVPVTMQVFFVLLSGMVLGPFWGATSQLIYLCMGLCGAPFFAAPPYAGPAVLFGPTGGYLWGFVLAAGVTGWVSAALSRRWRPRGLIPGVGYLCAGLAGIAVIYTAGTAWLGSLAEPARSERLGGLRTGRQTLYLARPYKGSGGGRPGRHGSTQATAAVIIRRAGEAPGLPGRTWLRRKTRTGFASRSKRWKWREKNPVSVSPTPP